MRTGCRNTPRTYDRWGCLKKEDKYASGAASIDAAPDAATGGIEKPDSQALKPDEWPP